MDETTEDCGKRREEKKGGEEDKYYHLLYIREMREQQK